jgi:transcription elongation factor Elf1
MAKLSEKLTHPFECPYCGEITLRPIRLKDEPLITCLRCGKATEMESAGTMREKSDKRDEWDARPDA